jgi:hypothetical protein
MNLLLKSTKYFTIKNILLGLITIFLGTLLKFLIIPKLLGLFNVTISEIVGYIVASFIALMVKLGIKDLVEQLVDILMPYLFMGTNSPHSPHSPHESGNESAYEKPKVNKGKGIATSTSSSDSEKPLDKGKATVADSDSEKSLGKTKTLVSITGNDALDEHKALSDRIYKLMSMQNLLTDAEKKELQSLLEIAKSRTNISLGSNSYPASSNSSGSVSPNGDSSYDEFPTYNPKDYESESESQNKGESSNKNK